MLESLYAGALADAGLRQERISLAEIEKQAQAASPPLDSVKFLSGGGFIKVIAEIKRASPSKGHLAKIADPQSLANTYQIAGAAAISVLTEERSFLGSLADFDTVKEIAQVPLLRKDFIASEYQVLESRAHGADIVLLIAAGLNKDLLKSLKDLVESLGMLAFVETHNLAEVELAAELDSKMVGINARDLATFETDRNLFATLAHGLPSETIKVAESAVRNPADVISYASAGADCVLVGEALVKGDAKSLLEAITVIPKA